MVFDQDAIRSLLQRQKIATLAELKGAGKFRHDDGVSKLKALGYRTSYSHRGKYYTLADIPRFDEQGLWSYDAVWFSRDKNLLATPSGLWKKPKPGSCRRVEDCLNVEVKEPLLQLYRRRRLTVTSWVAGMCTSPGILVSARSNAYA